MATIIPFPVNKSSPTHMEAGEVLAAVSMAIARLNQRPAAISTAQARLHWQLDALNHGLKLLGGERANEFPILSAVLANLAQTEEAGHLNGTTSRNAGVTAVSSCA